VRDIITYSSVSQREGGGDTPLSPVAMPDCGSEYSEIRLKCPARRYSASSIAMAAEDADAAVVALLACPSSKGDGMFEVYLRINRVDPSRAVRSLERHGFTVSEASGSEYADEELSRERISELQHYLNI